MLAFQQSLKNPEDRLRHHAMRIAAKRLRYTLEIAKPVYSPALEEILTAVKRVQTLLGEIHDCDVWQEHLERPLRPPSAVGWSRSLGTPGSSLAWKPASFTSSKSGMRHHHVVFQELVDYWRQLQERGVWNDLVRLVQPSPPAGQGLPSSNGSNGNSAKPYGIELPHSAAVRVERESEPIAR